MPTMVSAAVTRPSKPSLEQLRDRVDVVGQPGDDPAGGVAVVEGDVEPLEVAEHPAAQVEQHLPGRPGRRPQEHHPADRLQHDGAEQQRRARLQQGHASCRRTAAAARRSRCRPAPGAAPTAGRRSPARPRRSAAGRAAGTARAGRPAAAGCGCCRRSADGARGRRRRSRRRRRATAAPPAASACPCRARRPPAAGDRAGGRRVRLIGRPPPARRRRRAGGGRRAPSAEQLGVGADVR